MVPSLFQRQREPKNMLWLNTVMKLLQILELIVTEKWFTNSRRHQKVKISHP